MTVFSPKEFTLPLKKRCLALSLFQNQSGYTLLELLISLFVGSLLLASVLATALSSFVYYHDQNVRAKTDEKARIVLDMMAFELRMLGAGMPLSQDNFEIADDLLGDAPLPILTDAEDGFIQIRLNERGIHSFLTEDFTPSDLDFQVLSTADFAIDDVIYISNMTAGGEDGLRGTIAAISGNVVTLAEDYISSEDATFNAGSSVHRVSQIIFQSAEDGSGITRDNGSGAMTLLNNTTFEIDYQEAGGTLLELPLTEEVIRDDLDMLQLTVQVNSDSTLKNGTTYTAVARQNIMLRNLMIHRW